MLQSILRKSAIKSSSLCTKKSISEICENPYAGELKKGDLSGIYCYDLYYQGTNYEIAYLIEATGESEIIVIIMAGTRENFYEQLKKYWL